MKIKYQYLIFIVLLHVILTTLIYFVLEDNKWYFILSELLIIASLMLSYKIYTSFIKPIELMKTGVSAIKEKDYNVKFLATNSTEMNDLIEVFNAMLDKLGSEQVKTQEQAYFLESIIEASPIGMILLGFDGEVTDINGSARTYLQLEKSAELSLLEHISHPLAKSLSNLELGQSDIISVDGIHKYRCQVDNVVHKGFKRKFIMIEELSSELLKSEKEAYGKVIRMMAHEVNNSMGAVNSILQSVVDFAFDENSGNPEGREYIESLEIAKARNEDLAQFMKNFADVIRIPAPDKKEVDLVPFTQQCARLMTPLATDHNISIQTTASQETCPIHIDPNLIQQVIVNILKNAIESIGENGNIKILISHQQPHLIIADDGPGITPEVQAKLFSPFFSTKPTGQGIGLVLIRDILVGHGASFSLETNEESGWTEFRISFG